MALLMTELITWPDLTFPSNDLMLWKKAFPVAWPAVVLAAVTPIDWRHPLWPHLSSDRETLNDRVLWTVWR